MESSKPNRSFAFYFKRFFIWISILIISLLLLTWLTSPMIARWQINEQLNIHNKKLSDESSIRVNPFLLSLVIHNLKLQDLQSANAHLTLDSAEIDIGFWGLFSKELEIEVFKLDQLNIDIVRSDNNLTVAGFLITNDQSHPKAITSDTEDSKHSIKEESDQPPGQPWQVIADSILLSDLNLNIQNLSHQHLVSFDLLKLSEIIVDEQRQSASLEIEAKIDQGVLGLQATLNNQHSSGDLTLDLEFENFHLQDIAYLAQEQLQELNGIISLQAAQKISYQGSNVRISMPLASLEIASLATKLPGLQLTNQNLKVSLSNFNINSEANQPPQLAGQFNIANQNLNLTTDITGKNIFGLEKLTLNQGVLKLVDSKTPALKLETIQLDNISISEDLTDEEAKYPALAKIQGILLSELDFNGQHLDLKKISISKMESQLILDKNKQLANLILPNLDNTNSESDKERNETPQVTAAESNEITESNPFTFALADFSISDNSQLTFSDRSVTPNFAQTISISEISAKNIDNRKANNVIDFKVGFKTDAYAASELVGSVKPFAEKLNLNLTSKVREFSLPKVSPYMKEAMGFEMLSGQFDNDIEVIIEDDIIKGESKLVVRGLELSAADEAEVNSLKDQTALPLNSALSMLKDDKGNLELEIPLSGDVSSPEFGVNSFIALVTKKAVMAAAESYLIETFVPYANVLSVVRIAGEYMLKIDFEDLEFSPQAISIAESQHQFVNEFIALMKKEADTQVKVCAIATSSDLPDISANFEDSQYMQQLTKISQDRGQAFKAWVVEKGQIESNRLLLCQPQIDQAKDSKPRIEFEV